MKWLCRGLWRLMADFKPLIIFKFLLVWPGSKALLLLTILSILLLLFYSIRVYIQADSHSSGWYSQWQILSDGIRPIVVCIEKLDDDIHSGLYILCYSIIHLCPIHCYFCICSDRVILHFSFWSSHLLCSDMETWYYSAHSSVHEVNGYSALLVFCLLFS